MKKSKKLLKFITAASAAAVVISSSMSLNLNSKAKNPSLISEIANSLKPKIAQAWPPDVWPEDCRNTGRLSWLDSSHYREVWNCHDRNRHFIRSYTVDKPGQAPQAERELYYSQFICW